MPSYVIFREFTRGKFLGEKRYVTFEHQGMDSCGWTKFLAKAYRWDTRAGAEIWIKDFGEGQPVEIEEVVA